MAIIDSISWNPQGNDIIYAYKYPENNLSTYSQLVVNESQVALLFSKGELMGRFGPGKHTLNTENLPVLRRLFGIPFGGKNPFLAQVWFVNLIDSYSIPWAIKKLAIHDADYQTNLPLMIEGQYGVRVTDPEKFIIKMVGTRNVFDQRDLTLQFEGEFTTKAKSAIVSFMAQRHIGYKGISAHLAELSDLLRNVLSEFWKDQGIELTKFYVSDIDIDTSTPEGQKVKEAIATQSSMSITGHTWQQEQMFDTANNALSGLAGGNGGLLGGLMAINMMGGMGSGMGSAAMNPQFNQPTFSGNSFGQGANSYSQGGNQGGNQNVGVRMVYCSACAKKFPNTMDYCPNCGNKYRPCPNCGSDNPEAARRCVNCGRPLSGPTRKCPHCHTEVPEGYSFCPGCGQPIATDSDTCSRCGSLVPPTARFCPRCGNRRQ
ncbi:MAG: SPFH domain-containing protein [Muribaculaceae bacterium]|nr:SPFH domain-containing protein [Muribaculaceae bacterium]